MNEHYRGQIENMVQRLAATPDRLVRLLSNKSLEQLTRRPAQNQWSAQDILAHMRAVDDIFTVRIYTLLTREMPPLIALDERRWADIARYSFSSFNQALTLFTLKRIELIEVLRHQPAEAWQRSGIHEERGPLTLLAIVQDLVAHEEEHYAQLETLLTNRPL